LLFTIENEAFLYTQLANALKVCTWIESVDMILKTKVPVIKIKTAAVPVPDVGFKSLIWIDICIERPNSLQHLPLPRPLKVWPMKAKEFVIKMKNEFKLLKPLCLVLKQFLAHKGLNNAYHGGLSSYGLILMIVHILYQRKINRLSLSPSSCSGKKKSSNNGLNTNGNNYHQSNNLNSKFELAEMLLNFLTYYGIEFDPSINGIAMEAGSENLITFERRQAYCQGALVVQDPLDPTNNVTAGCFSFTTLQNEFRKAQVRIQSRYFEFRSLSLSINSNRESKNQVTNQEAISVLGALFDVPHHQNVVRYTALMWCPPEINMKKRQSSMDSMKINNSKDIQYKETTKALMVGNVSDNNNDNNSNSNSDDVAIITTALNSNNVTEMMEIKNKELLEYLRERNSLLTAENDYLKERLKLDNNIKKSTTWA